jgi:hypothetical protein
MTILPQGFWKSLKSLLGIREPQKEVPKSAGSQEKPKKEAQIPKRQVEKDSAQIIRRKLEKVHLQVGLDFGTHSTKVVYSQIGRPLSRALNFEHNLPNYPNYCLPSIASVDNHGKLTLGIDAAKLLLDKEWDLGFQRFKVIVAGEYDKGFRDPVSHENFNSYLRRHGYDKTFTSERLTAIYLAYAMKKAREVIEARREYQNVELDIAFNICMPIDHLENNKVKAVFEKIFAWSEAIGKAWHKTGKEFDPVRASYEVETKSHDQDKRVFAVPEAVAGIASYLVSLRKQEGLHAIIDLGAGTTDVSICNLRMPEGQSISYWYAARNIPRGTINVERIIASHLRDAKNSFCTPGEICTFIENLGSPAFYKKSSKEKYKSLLSNIQKEIENLRSSGEYYKTWGSAYRHFKKQSKWEKVEVFISGGGANLPYVEEVFSNPWWNQINVKYPVSRLPTPDDYNPGEGNAPFERMAVAYGLARPIPELDEYILPGGAPDDTPPPLPKRKELDRDDLYPK